MANSDLRFLASESAIVARRLLGCELHALVDGQSVVVRIVETEAYDQTDAASHSYRGETPRTSVMFGEAGHLYVYFTYGMHYCCNIVTGSKGEGSAVLIRAVEPVQGEPVLRSRRGEKEGVAVTNGPAKLCQALAIDKTMNGHDLRRAPIQLVVKPALADESVMQTTRIGITQAVDMPWRFYISNNPFVSKL